MSSSLQISDLLKVAKDIPILHTGINETAMEYSTYPVKEHPKLLSSTGKPASTPLNSMLAMRSIKIPTDRNDPNYKDRTLLETYKKNALTLTFRGTRATPVSAVEWEEFYLHLVPLVVEHPKILLSMSKELTKTMTKLYRASNDFIGDASLTVEQRSTLKLKSLCLPLLADDPWKPGALEDDEVDKIVLEEMALAAIPTDADEKRKFDNTVVLYKSALTLLRELLNHTFLRAVYHTSSRQAQNEYKEIQRTFVSKNSISRHPTVFTAIDIIDYIKNNCTCDNSKAIIQMKNSIAALIRYKGQNLVSWFQTFQPLVNKYKKAIGLATTLDDDDLKALWKEHFAKQITVAERTVMKTFQGTHLGTADVGKVKKLSDGVFDDTVLYRLLSLLTTSFEPYNPDNTVMTYLKQHAQALRWDNKLDFRPPREKEKEQDKPTDKTRDKGDGQSQKRRDKSSRKTDRSSSSTKKLRLTDKRTPNPKHNKSGDHCRRQNCRDRGTNTNHTHADCKFKESDKNIESDPKKHHPNLGRAPGKKPPRNTKTTTSRPEKHAITSHVKESGERRCYICNQPDHLANACPSKGKIKAGAQNSLYKNKSFMALWQSSFADQEQQKCATRLLKSWGDDLCPTCMGEISFDHRCDTNDVAIAKHTQTVRDVLRTTPLLETIRSAHEYQRDSTEKPAPINMGPDFFHDARGQDGSDNESASADAESQLSLSQEEDGDSNSERDHSGNSGDESSPPPSPTQSEDGLEDWE